MKALIIGEFSGVAKAMQFGLIKNNFEVDVIQARDGYKNIGKGNPFSLLSDYFSLGNKKYDLSIFLTPFIVWNDYLSRIFNEKILNISKNSVYCPCTSDSFYWDHLNISKEASRLTQYGLIKDYGGKKHRYSKQEYFQVNSELNHNVDKIIPLNNEYLDIYTKSKKVKQNKIIENIYLPYEINYSLLNKELDFTYDFYHGITRKHMKGTNQILKFFNGFPNHKKLITEKISSNEFYKNLKASKVFFDQTCSRDIGIAALNGLNFCPIVVSSIVRENIRSEICPVLDFQTERHKLTDVINNLDAKNLREKNLSYLEEFHNPEKIMCKILTNCT